MANPQEFRIGKPITAYKLNELVRSARDFEQIFREQKLDQPPKPHGFFARIAGEDVATRRYAWDEVEIYDGEIRDIDYGRAGRIEGVAGWTGDTIQPAAEFNNLAGIPTGCIVWLQSTTPSAPLTAGEAPEENYRFLCPDLNQIVRTMPADEVHSSGAKRGKVRSWNGSAFVDVYDCWLQAPEGSWGFFKFGCLTDSITTEARWIGSIEEVPLFQAVNTTPPLTALNGYSAGVPQALTHTQDGCLKWVTISACASGSGDGSGSGSGGGGGDGETVTVSCCGNPLPTTLYVTFSGEYADDLGTIAITWNGVVWISDEFELACGPFVTFYLYCSSGSWFFWTFTSGGSGGGSSGSPGPDLEIVSCDPLYLTGEGGVVADGGCIGDVVVTITETAP